MVSILSQCFPSQVSKLYASTTCKACHLCELSSTPKDPANKRLRLFVWPRGFRSRGVSIGRKRPTPPRHPRTPFASHDRRGYRAWLIKDSRLTVGSPQRRRQRAKFICQTSSFVSPFDILAFVLLLASCRLLAEIANRVASSRNIAEFLDESSPGLARSLSLSARYCTPWGKHGSSSRLWHAPRRSLIGSLVDVPKGRNSCAYTLRRCNLQLRPPGRKTRRNDYANVKCGNDRVCAKVQGSTTLGRFCFSKHSLLALRMDQRELLSSRSHLQLVSKPVASTRKSRGLFCSRASFVRFFLFNSSIRLHPWSPLNRQFNREHAPSGGKQSIVFCLVIYY